MRTYTSGNDLTFTTTVIDPTTQAPVNPSKVVLRLRDPDGLEVDPVVTNPSTGVFSATITPSICGVWKYRWQATGIVNASREGHFEIRATDFGE